MREVVNCVGSVVLIWFLGGWFNGVIVVVVVIVIYLDLWEVGVVVL